MELKAKEVYKNMTITYAGYEVISIRGYTSLNGDLIDWRTGNFLFCKWKEGENDNDNYRGSRSNGSIYLFGINGRSSGMQRCKDSKNYGRKEAINPVS